MINPFEPLGISPTLSEDEVRRAYHEKARRVHPDQFPDGPEQDAATRKMILLNQAYEEAMALVKSRSVSPYLLTLPCEDAVELVDEIIEKAECPLVFDADALNVISYNHWQDRLKDRCLRGFGSVITPHMGEAARLLKDDEGFDIETEGREEILNELYDITGATVVLKGNRTLVRPMFGGSLDPVYVNTTGNPGMATAGSGDVLTGIIAALLGQGVRNAVMTGVYIHGLAGDLMAEEVGEYSLISRDILKGIPMAFKNILEEQNGL